MTGESISTFISKWRGASGGERAQSQTFLLEFCQALGLEEPKEGDYKFEFDVQGDKGRNFIDLYKRGCFVLESKQSRARRERSEFSGQLDLLPEGRSPARRGKASRAWDVLMNNARQQAENYARHLPPDHDWPPFIIVCDVGHCFELYADFTGKGRNYAQFPDRQCFRISWTICAKPEVQNLFRADLDRSARARSHAPRRQGHARHRRAAAAVSKHMEAAQAPGEDVADFLMRCIFTMFAEDVGLLPKDAFKDLLNRAIDKPADLPPRARNAVGGDGQGRLCLRRAGEGAQFNGYLFKHAPCLRAGAGGDRRTDARPRSRTGARWTRRSSARCWNRRSTRGSAPSSARITRRAPMSSAW